MDSAAMWTTAMTYKPVDHRAWTTKDPLPTLSTVAVSTIAGLRIKKDETQEPAFESFGPRPLHGYVSSFDTVESSKIY